MGKYGPGGWGSARDFALCRWRQTLMSGQGQLCRGIFRFRSVVGLALAVACFISPGLSQESADGGPTFTVSDLPVGRPLRIVVYGDMRFTNPSNTGDTHPGVRKYLAQKVAEVNPDIMLITGDMPFHGSDAGDWKIYNDETAAWTQQRLRIYPTIGNHERLPDPRRGMENYFAAYPQIDHHAWYSVQLGNIYLITLDTSSLLNRGGVQRIWLESQLAHLPASADFVFFLFHVPLVSDLQTAFVLGIPDANTLDLRHELEANAARSHAKFVIFNGHIHNYERFDMNGIMHVISGGGGARPYPIFIRGDQDLYHARTY